MSLSIEETQRLRDAWGDKPCDHPNITKERGPMGQQTDYACTICGAVAWSRKDLEKEGEKAKKLMQK